MKWASKQLGAPVPLKNRPPVWQSMAPVPNTPKVILAPILTHIVKGLRQLTQLITYYRTPPQFKNNLISSLPCYYYKTYLAQYKEGNKTITYSFVSLSKCRTFTTNHSSFSSSDFTLAATWNDRAQMAESTYDTNVYKTCGCTYGQNKIIGSREYLWLNSSYRCVSSTIWFLKDVIIPIHTKFAFNLLMGVHLLTNFIQYFQF
jgi:hypothetical protein